MKELTSRERILRTYRRQETDRIPMLDTAWAGTIRRWQQEGFHGGINAQLWDDIELVKAEMERIIPAMKKGGGYVFASDHSIPNSVSFDNMKQIAELAHKLGAY